MTCPYDGVIIYLYVKRRRSLTEKSGPLPRAEDDLMDPNKEINVLYPTSPSLYCHFNQTHSPYLLLCF